MNGLKRLKPYKANNPIKTINKIREILEKCNIFTIEDHNNNSEDFFSCSIQLKTTNIKGISIGTNGKGLTTEYSLASGYAEFMERLQNGFIFGNLYYATKKYLAENKEQIGNSFIEKLKQRDLILDFSTAPDEKYMTVEHIIEESYELIKNILNFKNKSELMTFLKKCSSNNEIKCLPFFCVKNKSIYNLPFFLTFFDTNGMCAGNTKEEAIIQGICEIFERFAVKKIYSEELTPPTIPREYFYGTDILERIERIEKNQGLKIIFKDCSLGEKLPVIGTLVINTNENKYSFILGADPSPITALERCLCELYQGFLKSKYIHLSENPFHLKGKFSQNLKEINFKRILANWTGNWPNSIFLNKSSYPFEEFKYPISRSDSEDLKYLINLINEQGYILCVRDVTFLDFPALNIYIPKMSEMRPASHYIKLLELRKNFPTLWNIKSSDMKDIAVLGEIVEQNPDLNIRNQFLFNNSDHIKNLNTELFLATIFFRVRNFKKSYIHINNFLTRIAPENRAEFIYYFCVRDYIKLLIDGYQEEDILEILTLLYDKNLVIKVIKSMANPNDVFNKFNLSSCFNCDKCDIEANCNYFEILKFAHMFQEKYKENLIDQKSLQCLFP